MGPDPKGPFLLANLGIPALAGITTAAGSGPGFTDDSVPDLPTLDRLSHFGDHAGEFMPENDRRPIGMAIVKDMEVAAANRRRFDLYPDFVVFNVRFGDFPHFDHPGAFCIFYYRFHFIPFDELEILFDISPFWVGTPYILYGFRVSAKGLSKGTPDSESGPKLLTLFKAGPYSEPFDTSQAGPASWKI
jgi:hypothetical protein